MARPERNNVDYFPFYCEEGKKMYYIEETYGNDGFAVFIKLLRELAKAEYHYLDLSKKTTIMFLAAKCKVTVDVLTAIINDLVELEKFDNELWSENRIIWCEDFINSIQDAYKKRNNKCIDYNGLLLLLQSKGIRKPSKSTRKPTKDQSEVPVNPQSKEEYSKEEYIKPKEITPEQFYNLEIEQNKETDFKVLYEQYIKYVNLVLGKTSEVRDTANFLKMKEQLSFEQFRNCIEVSKKYNVNFAKTITAMINYKDIWKNKSVNLTAKKWMDSEYKRNNN